MDAEDTLLQENSIVPVDHDAQADVAIAVDGMHLKKDQIASTADEQELTRCLGLRKRKEEEQKETSLVEDKHGDRCDGDMKGLPSDPPLEPSEDDEDDCIGKEILRGDWEPIMAMAESLFRLALLQHLPKDHGIALNSICCIDAIRGGYNFVRILDVDAGPYAGRYIVKVPSVGTAARWQESDAYMLRNDTRTIDYIAKHTTIPCPEIVCFDNTLTNVLNAPYVIMRANNGIPANKIWFDEDEEGEDDFTNAMLVDEERMATRVNFLRSLAQQMSKLQVLEFNHAGTLNFDQDPENPTVRPTYHWHTTSRMMQLTVQDLSTPASIICIPQMAKCSTYFRGPLNAIWPRELNARTHINNSRRQIMEYVLAFLPFDESKRTGAKKETFILRHDDLDFQNILCDEKGIVTGIVDWDKVRVAPRCLGYASLPNLVGRMTKELKTMWTFDSADVLTSLGKGNWDFGDLAIKQDIYAFVAPQSKVDAIEPTVYGAGEMDDEEGEEEEDYEL